MRHSRRLYTRIYWHIVGVLLVVGLATSGLFSLMFRSAHNWRGPAEHLARQAAAQYADRLDDRDALLARARRMAAEYDIDVTLRDASGRLLGAVGPELPSLPRGEAARLREGPLLVSQRYGRWFVAAPIEDSAGALRGVLEVSLMRHLPMPNLLRPVTFLGIVLALLALATWPLARRISRPVERLTEANRRLGAGDLSYRISLPCPPRHRRWHAHPRHQRKDELMELMRSWNEMAERIERLLRGQKELLANVSHELRSPLARVRVALALLDDPAEVGAPVAARLRDVEADLGELERLIDDVLTTARLDATGLPVRPGQVAVRPLLEQLAARAGQGVAVDLAPGLADLEVSADGALLRRALWNLVENALKYGAPPIVLAAAAHGDEIEFTVTDDGPGISSAERERVLEPFYRTDKARTPHKDPASSPDRAGSEARQPGGFGLGLTLALRVAQVHGGTVRVEAARQEQGRDVGCRVVLTIAAQPG